MSKGNPRPKQELISIIIMIVVAAVVIGYTIFKLIKFYNYGLIQHNEKEEERQGANKKIGGEASEETGQEERQSTAGSASESVEQILGQS